MQEVYSLVSIAIFVSPFIAGAVAYFGIWFRDEFWKKQLYDYND